MLLTQSSIIFHTKHFSDTILQEHCIRSSRNGVITEDMATCDVPVDSNTGSPKDSQEWAFWATN